jgi:hypothetical protein
VVGSSEDERLVGPALAALDASGQASWTAVFDTAFCGGDLTTVEDASATNELKLDEHLSRVEEQIIIEVTADSGEVSGLDKMPLEPKLDSPNADLRAGESEDLADDEPGDAEGTARGTPAGEAILEGGGPPHGESDGSVESDGAAGVEGSSEEERLAGPALRSAEASGTGGSTAVSAIADDAGDLTAAHAETTNELNCDEIVIEYKSHILFRLRRILARFRDLTRGERSENLTTR